MSYYDRAEQETHYNYDPFVGKWRLYSTYPPHVKKILSHAAVITGTETDGEGRVIGVSAYADANQIRLFKPRL